MAIVKLSDYVNFIETTDSEILALVKNNNINFESWAEIETSFGATLDEKVSLLNTGFQCYNPTTYLYVPGDNSLVASPSCINNPSDANCCTSGNVVGFQL